jgi:hypothetical protein
MAHIKRMDDIYGHAAFTIVNAGHQHRLIADSPLSGVRPDMLLVEQTGIDVLPIKKSDAEIQLYYTSHNLSIKALTKGELYSSIIYIKLRVSRFYVTTSKKLNARRTKHVSG